MNSTNPKIQALILGLIIATGYLISGMLGAHTYFINYWPTDSYYFYFPAARQLFSLPYLSSMHNVHNPESLGVLAMHGKEALVLGIAIMQRLLNDIQSLFPNILLLIQAQFISSILIYLIFKKLFDWKIALLAFIVFTFTFWPYLYIIQGAHQPLVLLFFLLTFSILLYFHTYSFSFFLAGLTLGLMLFSSPTAILYLPYFLLLIFFIPVNPALKHSSPIKIMICVFLMASGFLAPVILFTYPDIIISLRDFITFVFSSQAANHFYSYRDFLSQHLPAPYSLDLPAPISFKGGGWMWVLKYFLLIIPLLFCGFLLSIISLLRTYEHRYKHFLIIVLCVSTPIAVEISQVAQFGRNYYSWFFGMIFVICLALHEHEDRSAGKTSKSVRLAKLTVLFSLIVVHILLNLQLFTQDILPSRMATTYIQQWLLKNNINHVSVFRNHPNTLLTYFLNNPKSEKRVSVKVIESISQVKSGLILVPPVTGMNIITDCSKNDFNVDPHFTELYSSGRLESFVVKKFRTMASSKIWIQEEEVCTFRDLILNHLSDEDRKTKGVALLLDADKLQREWFN